MKKLNRKGFTLVELLAVIVILAIVVGITLVTVLPTLKNARIKAFELTAQTAADYFEKQYQLYLIGEHDNTPSEVIDVINKSLADGKAYFTPAVLEAAGLKPENYILGSVEVKSDTGRACVTLVPSTNGSVAAEVYNMAGKIEAGEYYDVNNTTGKGKVWKKLPIQLEPEDTREQVEGLPVRLAKSSACS